MQVKAWCGPCKAWCVKLFKSTLLVGYTKIGTLIKWAEETRMIRATTKKGWMTRIRPIPYLPGRPSTGAVSGLPELPERPRAYTTLAVSYRSRPSSPGIALPGSWTQSGPDTLLTAGTVQNCANLDFFYHLSQIKGHQGSPRTTRTSLLPEGSQPIAMLYRWERIVP